MIKDLVSVITPVYNGEKYVKNILESILNQTYKNIEFFIVDDGSTDNTIKIINTYIDCFKKQNISFNLIKSTHKNASSAINKALPLIKGEFLIWPDADDILEPTSIEKRVNFLKENDYKIVRSIAYYFDENTKNKLSIKEECFENLDKKDLFLDILFSYTFVCCGCYMIHVTEFFDIYKNKKIPEYDIGQNFQMLLPYLYKYKCYTIKEELYGVCVRNNSHSRKALTQKEEENKYNDYEKLIDELVSIINIKDEYILNKIRAWKNFRRYEINKKYNNKQKALKAIKELKKYKEISFFNYIKRIIRILIRNTFFEKILMKLFKNNISYPYFFQKS